MGHLTSNLLPCCCSRQKHQLNGGQTADLSAAQELSSNAVSAIADEDNACCAAAAAAPAAEAEFPAMADATQQCPATAEESVAPASEDSVAGQQRESESLREEEAAAGEQEEGVAAEHSIGQLQGPQLEAVMSLDVDVEEAGSQGSGPMVTVQRGIPASITADEEVRAPPAMLS